MGFQTPDGAESGRGCIAQVLKALFSGYYVYSAKSFLAKGFSALKHAQPDYRK